MTSIGSGMSNFGNSHLLTEEELEARFGKVDEDEGFFSSGYEAASGDEGFYSEGMADGSLDWQTKEDIRRLREKAGVKTGFMDRAKDWLGSEQGEMAMGALADMAEGVGGGQTGQAPMSADMAQQLANTFDPERARGPIPRLGALPRMPGRSRPVSVKPPAQPRPQPPYNLLRTDYGFPMTQKMLPTSRLAAKAKGMR